MDERRFIELYGSEYDITGFSRGGFHSYLSQEADVILHTAGLNRQECQTFPDQAIEDNIKLTQQIIESIYQHPKPIIYLSSIEVYGESYPVEHPVSIYGKTKYEAEQLLCQYQERYPDQDLLTILRLSPVYDGGIGNTRKYIHIDDVCDIIDCAIQDCNPGIYNITPSNAPYETDYPQFILSLRNIYAN